MKIFVAKRNFLNLFLNLRLKLLKFNDNNKRKPNSLHHNLAYIMACNERGINPKGVFCIIRWRP